MSSAPADRSGVMPRTEARSIGELFTDLAEQTGTLVRQEVKLATTEMTGKATYAGRQTIFIATGMLLGAVSLLALVGALVFGLATVVELWLSALVVGVVIAIVAVVMIWKGAAALRDMSLTPKQTALSLKEDKQWVQEQVR